VTWLYKPSGFGIKLQYSYGVLEVVTGGRDKLVQDEPFPSLVGFQIPWTNRFDPLAFAVLTHHLLPLRVRNLPESNILLSQRFSKVTLFVSQSVSHQGKVAND